MSHLNSIISGSIVKQSRHAVLLPRGDAGTVPQLEISQQDSLGRISEIRVTCHCGETCVVGLNYDDNPH